MRLPTINLNGGHRSIYNVQVKVMEITPERHWKNLWLKKTMKIGLELMSVPNGVFENINGNKIDFPKIIIIHDFAKEFSKISIEDILNMQIGYADKDQQYWHGVRIFSGTLFINEKQFVLM